MKTCTIKHKLWGKLKKKAHDAYKIAPAKVSGLFKVKDEENNWFSSNYTLEEAIDLVEYYREVEFKKLCYQALYEHRKKRVENL